MQIESVRAIFSFIEYERRQQVGIFMEVDISLRIPKYEYDYL